ncbi:type II toxin-antitoxin system RelE/ParE family toxin [Roseibium sp. FZY0029]|uniref:type II toxin-antitoxin system RelE/ParE family toxin n=1 Tax=Roseibium sp. FZY0029 TaxID=3116647 RepID=UPI002EA0EEC0|nr:type II toxin-antitoxin system RelE/ParE family toxin [Roseibium sp. FZY0029]
MAYKVSRKAAEDIANIYIEGVSGFGVAQAEKYHAEMEATFDLISSNPRIARERQEIDPPVHIHPFGSHIVIYTVDAKNDVLIIRVRHGREDWKHNPAE